LELQLQALPPSLPVACDFKRVHPYLLPNVPALQEKLDALDCGRRFVDASWHTWDDAEEGGALKPSRVL
jgi:hypothetical protein